MRTKDTVFLIIMILLFAITAGMFYYQNFYLKNELEKNKVPILIATKDIFPGTTIDKNNTKQLKIDKSILNRNILTRKDKIKDPIAKEKILKGEFVSKKRVKSKNDKSKKQSTYVINLNPDFSSDVKKGDFIRVYLQIANKDSTEVKNYLVYNRKEVLNVIKDDDIRDVGKLKVRVTDKEALAYYNAKEKGQIIVLKYEDVANSDIEIPKLKIGAENNEG